LGRPFGVPNDKAFQKKVLLAALKLLEADRGPVLEEFPEDPLVSGEMTTVLSCPVDLAVEEQNLSETEKLRVTFKWEMTQLRSWYDLSVKKRGRTTVGVSGLDPDSICAFISAFLNGKIPENPRDDLPVEFALKLAVDDLKAYYFEAVTAQPGQESPGSNTFANWFWGKTVAGKVLFALKTRCTNSDNDRLRLVGNMFMIPAAQAYGLT